MERSNHRARSLPTSELVAELVVRLVDTMLDGDLNRLESPRARTVFRELSSRIGDPVPPATACTCSSCLGDLIPVPPGPGPFDR